MQFNIIGNILMKYILIIITFLFLLNGYSQKSTTEKIGDINKILIPAAAGFTSILLNDKEGSWQFLKSYGTTIALTYALKYAINKQRPEGNGNYGFPSGHTSSAFSGASFIQKRYGWEFGVPAYILAGFTGYSRLYAKKHDGWDVLFGAIIGIGSTYIFTDPYTQKHIELTFNSKNNNYLLGFNYYF